MCYRPVQCSPKELYILEDYNDISTLMFGNVFVNMKINCSFKICRLQILYLGLNLY